MSAKLSRKGISPLIAAVLLIAFTMTIAAILATWAQTFGQERLKGASERGERAIECSALSMRVESASWIDSDDDGNNDRIQAVAWNTGDGNLTKMNFIVYNSTELPNTVELNNNVTIKPGNYKILKADGMTDTPKKLEVRALSERCPKVQPLYTCTYAGGGSFNC